MAKPNYSFEKRQRDLAKQRKKEEKRLRKAGKTDVPGDIASSPELPSESEPGEPGVAPTSDESEPTAAPAVTTAES